MYQHFILTRFNLRLWTKDKNGQQTRTTEWLEKRFKLFETFCLPSIKNQSIHNFKWIVLFDAETPEPYRIRIDAYKKECNAFTPYFIAPKDGRYFARIFQKIVAEQIQPDDIVITTYLDNDDALRYDYIEKIQELATRVEDKTFISFKYGLQYFTQLNIATLVPFMNNHFISLVERNTPLSGIRTVFGYGSHIAIHSYAGTHTLYINQPSQAEWMEVVHETNMDNDIRMTFDTHLITDPHKLQREYGLSLQLSPHPRRIFCSRFLPRAIKEVLRHIRYRIVGRKWE